MERTLISDSNFYKKILDCTDKVNECIKDFGFTLDYNISSKSKGHVNFTVSHGHGFDRISYTFSYQIEQCKEWTDNQIASSTINYIKEIIVNSINHRFMLSNTPIQETVGYEDPEDILTQRQDMLTGDPLTELKS